MPTPLELLLDPVSLTVFAIYAALILGEGLAPARALPLLAIAGRCGILQPPGLRAGHRIL